MKDKNGIEIKSGDSLRYPEQFGDSIAKVVMYSNGELGLDGCEIYVSELVEDIEIVSSNT